MLDYEWGNPSVPIMLNGEQTGQDPEPNRPVFDTYATQNFYNPADFTTPGHHFAAGSNHYHHHHQMANFYNPSGSTLTLDPSGSTGFTMLPKNEPVAGEFGFVNEFNTASASRIGLDLGGRTYFASSEDDFVSRLYRRSRILEPGSVNFPRCQAEGCKADLTHAKHYHRRHKVCEFHSKAAATLLSGGVTQRFCQQCSRFHMLSEFDNGKRSCRRRLADHNRRRRKSQQTNQGNNISPSVTNAPNSSSDQNIARSPPDSEPYSSSSVTVAISPPRISLDHFGHRSYTNFQCS